MNINIKLSIEKKHLYVMILSIVVVAFISGVVAYTYSVPNPGHSWNQMACDNNLCVNTNTGNVGIGTTAPGAKLDVEGPSGTGDFDALLLGKVSGYGSSKFTQYYNTDSRYGLKFGLPGTTNYRSGIILDALAGSNTEGQIMFYTANSEKVRIDKNGNVGIGTTNPGAKLDISGNIKIADGTQGAGKVLTSDANGLASWKTPVGGSKIYTAIGTTAVSTAASYYEDMPDMSITQTFEAGKIFILFTAPIWYTTTWTGRFRILIDGKEVAKTAQSGGSGWVVNVVLSTVQTISAGTHTIKVQWYSGDGSQYTYQSGTADGPRVLTVITGQ